MSTRENALQSWLTQQLNSNDFALSLLAGDASFRRYFRIIHQGKSWVAMDAPPEFEPIAPFVGVANLLNSHGVSVPKIEALDQGRGFILMEDLGDTVFLDTLNADTANQSYQKALDLLLQMQTIPTNQSLLGRYTATRMLSELQLFIDWFCERYLSLGLNKQEKTLLDKIFTELANEIASIDVCFVHRDYHSRNIMVVNQNSVELSIIDFQDAIIGPYPHDVVSLLKDCYIDWPDDQQQRWCRYYFEKSSFSETRSFGQFMLDYHLCGLQRHLRILGTFSRLYLRDGKNRYLADMPRILDYINHALMVTERYPSLQQFFNNRVRLP